MKLTFIQKRTIVQVAQEAFESWPEREAFEREHGVPGMQPFTAWRHEQQLAAVGLQSLNLCSEEHYRPLVAHFCRLRGEYRAAGATLSLNLT
jgi:hypothetical protein